jgi:AcrR family transcriptional regulator
VSGTPGGEAARAEAGQPGRGREPRRDLLDAADRIVQRDGPAASMQAIAAEAGITKPILYRHFGDKSGLYQALAERHISALVARVGAELVGPGSRRERSRAALNAYLESIALRPNVYWFVVHRAAVEDAGVRGLVTFAQERIASELASGLAVEFGVSDEPRVTIWAHGIVGMVQAVGEWWLRHPDAPRGDVVDELVELLWGAAGRGPATDGQPVT